MESLGVDAATAAPPHVHNKYRRPFYDVLKDSTPKTDSDDGGGESAPIALTQPCYPGNSAEELCCFCETLRVRAHQRVCVCVRERVHKIGTQVPNAGNNKERDFPPLCRGLEIHRGSTFSSRRKVYAFCSQERQQP